MYSAGPFTRETDLWFPNDGGRLSHVLNQVVLISCLLSCREISFCFQKFVSKIRTLSAILEVYVCIYNCKSTSSPAHLKKTRAKANTCRVQLVKPEWGGTTSLTYTCAPTRWAKQVARTSEIILSTADRDTNNGIRMNRRAERGTLTPANCNVKRRMAE